MAAKDHLSPRLFHSTDSDLQPGDLIHPGHRKAGGRHYSDDFAHIGHGDFTWASAGRPKPSFGNNHYEVEPTGMANPYTLHEDWRSGVTARADAPNAEPRELDSYDAIHRNNWVSLAPLRVKGKVTSKGEPWKKATVADHVKRLDTATSPDHEDG